MPSDSTGPEHTSTIADPSVPTGTAQDKSLRLVGSAFESWRSRLLDLTGRNRALNYRPTKVASLAIVDEKPAEVYRLLVGQERPLSFSAALPSSSEEPQQQGQASEQLGLVELGPAQSFTPYEPGNLDEHHRDDVLQCRATPESLDLSLRRIAEQQRTSLEEQGVNTVFLALGFLHYRESTNSHEANRAPLVLVPVTLERKGAKARFQLLLGDDEPMVNPSLVEYLRRFHGFSEFPEIPEPGDDEGAFDLIPFFSAVSDRVEHLAGWKVTEEIVLAPFSFQKLVIYKDLEQNQEMFARHPLVRRVVLKENEPAHDLPAEIREMDLDAEYPPEGTNQVVDADSSQLRAIAAVAAGHDLVIHGPPGTGKSQTITNLIADAVGVGKRVLFVSEKMAALEVVYRRLVEARLGEFCLELHSTKARKTDVVESLRRALEHSGAPTAGTVSRAQELARTRDNLNTYAKELHAKRSRLALSVFEAIGRLEASHHAPRVPYPGDPTALSPEQLGDIEEKLRHLETQGLLVAPVSENGWRNSRITAFSETISEQLGQAVNGACELARDFLLNAQAIHVQFGVRQPVGVSDVDPAVELAEHIGRSPGVPAGVLRDRSWERPRPEIASLFEEGRRVSARSRLLESRYNSELLDSVSEQDLEYMETRLGSPFAFLAFLAPRYRNVRRRLRAMRKPTNALPLIEQVGDLRAVPAWRRDRDSLAAHPRAREWFGCSWRGADSDWSDLEQRVAWLSRFHSLVSRHGDPEEVGYQVAEHGGVQSALPGTLAGVSRRFSEAICSLRAALAWPPDYLHGDAVSTILVQLDELERDRSKGAPWAAFVRAVLAVAGTTAAPYGEAVYCGRISATDATSAFRRALYGSWLDAVLPQVPALQDFAAATHEDSRQRFQKLDLQLLTEKRGELVSRLRDLGQQRYATSLASHRTFLSKELAKQKRHRPLRVTLREAREAVMAL